MEHNIPFNPEIGQLWPAERQLLFDTVIDNKPTNILEIGTWKGAGSTLIIATALKTIGSGHLYTCEPDVSLFECAMKVFADNSWFPFITLLNCKSKEAIEYLNMIEVIPDMVFFDGPDDPNVAVEDIKELEKIIRPNTTFMMHDWENKESCKQDIIKPYINSSDIWKVEQVLMPPISVGLVVAKFIGPSKTHNYDKSSHNLASDQKSLHKPHYDDIQD